MYQAALSLSLSMDIFSPSVEQVRLLEALSTKLPLPTDASKSQQVVYAQVFIAHVLSRIEGITSIHNFAQRLYKSRYSLLYPENSLLMQNNKFDCFADRPEFHEEVIRR